MTAQQCEELYSTVRQIFIERSFLFIQCPDGILLNRAVESGLITQDEAKAIVDWLQQEATE